MRVRIAFATGLVLMAVGLGNAGTAAAAELVETHVFEPVRSLTGACGANKLDPIPDPNCPGGPNAGAFFNPTAVATDEHGDVYVSTFKPSFAGSLISVFDPEGHFLTQIDLEGEFARRLAVDSTGVLYAVVGGTGHVLTYEPTMYEPASGAIEYPAVPTADRVLGDFIEIGADDHLVVLHNEFFPSAGFIGVTEYSSEAEGSAKIRDVPLAIDRLGEFAVDRRNGDMYLGTVIGGDSFPSVVKVFDKDGDLKEQIDGVETPEGHQEFTSPFGGLPLDVEEATGNLFVADLERGKTAPVYELTPDRELVSIVEHSFQSTSPGDLTIDNSTQSDNLGYLYVVSNPEGTGHSYAFAPKPESGPPLISGQRIDGISETEAVLRAEINPNGLATAYHFEYVTAATFAKDEEELGAGEGFAHATSTAAEALPAGSASVPVSAELTGLASGTSYRFRVVASNACEDAPPDGECVSAGEAESFATYPSATVSGSCPNDAFRIGASEGLADCRAYELVTPPSTNSQPPQTIGLGIGAFFLSPPATATGDSLAFATIGGPIGTVGGTGAFWGDPYVSQRAAAGWQTSYVGPSGEQTINPVIGSLSADHEFAFLTTDDGHEGAGTMVVDGEASTYLRKPDGSYSLLADGPVGYDPEAEGLLITSGGVHVLFSSVVQLTADAPPSGTRAIYDRPSGGVPEVVSLLPGEISPAGGENARPLGSDADGSTVAFGIGSSTYVRRDGQTIEVPASVEEFEGLSADGRYLFYLSGGDLSRFDLDEGVTQAIAGSHDVVPVNVSADGSTAYFISRKVLTPEVGPGGGAAKKNQENLYMWSGGGIRYVGAVTPTDVTGEGSAVAHALGRWNEVAQFRGLGARDPSRSTADGSVLLFESRADLTSNGSNGHRQVYRFEAGDESKLTCVSCNPTQVPATADAQLMDLLFLGFNDPVVAANGYTLIPNLSTDGRRAIFESDEPLVAADTDGLKDVYEWEANGVGSCERPDGCVFLISSGSSGIADSLVGVSADGDDVFFRTGDLLTPGDAEATPSIYDARVGGGFPTSTETSECLGEACQPAARPPDDPTPASATFHGKGNVTEKRRPCPAGKRQVKVKGKKKCVVKKKRNHKPQAKKPSGRRSNDDRRTDR